MLTFAIAFLISLCRDPLPLANRARAADRARVELIELAEPATSRRGGLDPAAWRTRAATVILRAYALSQKPALRAPVPSKAVYGWSEGSCHQRI